MVKDATISLADLRLRFSLYGDMTKLGPHRIIDPPDFIGTAGFCGSGVEGGAGPGFIFTVGAVTVKLNIPFLVFGGYPFSYGITKEKGTLFFDVILYSGRRRSLDFRTLERACLGFTIEVQDAPGEDAVSSACIEGGLLKVRLDGKKSIVAAIPAKPSVIEELYAGSYGKIDDKDVNDYV
jgi:hypothetical protein